MKIIMNRLVICIAMLTSNCFMSANASLIGQDVGLGLISVAQGSDEIVFIAEDDLDNPIVVTVIEGEAEANGFIDGFMNVDIEAESLGVLFPGGIIIDGNATSLNAALNTGPLDFIGLLFANLSWGDENPGQIVGITNLQTNIEGFTLSNVLFDESNVAFNILDLALNAQSFIIADLVVEHAARQVPVTGTFVLFGLAAFGLRLSRKN